eukprot:EG_transcript_23467
MKLGDVILLFCAGRNDGSMINVSFNYESRKTLKTKYDVFGDVLTFVSWDLYAVAEDVELRLLKVAPAMAALQRLFRAKVVELQGSRPLPVLFGNRQRGQRRLPMVAHVNLRSENFRAEVHGADLKALFRVIRKQAERPDFWTAWLRYDSTVDCLGDPRWTAEWYDRVLDCIAPSRTGPTSKESDLSQPPPTPVSIMADGRSQTVSLTSAEGLVPSPQPAALVHLTLTRYQQQGLTWLLAREAPSDAPRRPHPIWEEMPIHEYNESEGCLVAVPGAQ